MRFWFYMIRSQWRVIRGRWYVWRDVPTVVVRQAAALWFVTRQDKDAGPEVKSVISQARNEYKLRKNRGEA
jgi:hypothetical protein